MQVQPQESVDIAVSEDVGRNVTRIRNVGVFCSSGLCFLSFKLSEPSEGSVSCKPNFGVYLDKRRRFKRGVGQT